MKRYLIPQNGNFYKANLHMHTTVSDGRMTPEETKRAYVEKGYSIVAFTDHEIIVPHHELTDENFLAITACEFSITEEAPQLPSSYKRTYHMNMLSKDPNKVLFPMFSADHVRRKNSQSYLTEEMKTYHREYEYSPDFVNEFIASANAEGFLVTYNHPVWSQQSYADYIPLKGLWGVEIYNSTCVRIGYPDTPQPLDDLLRGGERVFTLATDDAHSLDDCFSGWVMVKAERLEYGVVMDALEHGDFYASAGPEIHELSVEDGILHVRTSDAVKIFFSSERRMAGSIRAEAGKTICEASFDLTRYLEETAVPEKAYIRVTVEDANGKRAWSRAYFLDELN